MTVRRVVTRRYIHDEFVVEEQPVKPVKKAVPKTEKEQVETITKDGSVVNLRHLQTAVSEIIRHSKEPVGHCAEGKSVSTTGLVSSVFGGQCHAYIGRIIKPSVHYSLWTGTRKSRATSEATEAYFRWVTGPDSPWIEGMPKRLEVSVEGKKYDLGSQEFFHDYGFVFWNIDRLPSNVQHQFLIAVRQPAECSYRVSAWHYLVQQGLDPTFSYMWQSLFQDGAIKSISLKQQEDKISFQMMNYSEFNLDTSTMDEEGICNFLLHKMNKKEYNLPFKENQCYTPVNKLWGRNTLTPSKGAYPSILMKRYGKEIGSLRSSNSFSGAAANPIWTGKLSDVVEMGWREQERLFTELGIKARKIV